jgi:hypothetical protein
MRFLCLHGMGTNGKVGLLDGWQLNKADGSVDLRDTDW